MDTTYDAVVVGSGPNGLAGAIELAEASRSVLVLEAAASLGGGMRSTELTLPGYLHDECSAVHPLALASPFFRELDLARYGLQWIHPEAPLAHPLDDGTAVLLQRSIQETADSLGVDREAYLRCMEPLVNEWEKLLSDILGPLPLLPRHPITLARFGLMALRSARGFAKRTFRGARARALFAGLAAHSMLPLEKLGSAAVGLVLGLLAHAVGWPLARGGSRSLAEAMLAHFHSLGGVVRTGYQVQTLTQIPQANIVLWDITPLQLLAIAGDGLPGSYQDDLHRYRYGPGVFKMDWALETPIPWKAPECRRAATVHLGGTLDEIALSERLAWKGEHPQQPFVLLVQPTLFDPSRAPQGKHIAWAYCHVPNGSTFDMSAAIEDQVERFAPGFKQRVSARSIRSAAAMEAYNPNYVGGDINGGVQDLRQQYTRPVPRLNPYAVPMKGHFICSSATPPGGGVHGMCGYHAAKAALRSA